MTPAASSGMMPDHRPDLDRHDVAVGRDAAGRRRSPSASSHSPCCVDRVADRGEVLEELHAPGPSSGRCPVRLQDRRDRAPWRGRRTPSSRWRRTARACRPPAGASGRSGRCCPGRGSRPRTGSLPSASSRLTHQVKLTSSLSKTAARGSRGRGRRRCANTSQRRPGVHRRVDVAEVPLVGRQRAVRVLEPLAAQQQQLVLGERRVDVRQRDAVEGEVPGGEPRVLPLVRHRHDVEGVEVCASGRCGPCGALGRRRRLGRVAVEPAGDVVVVELLAPQHPGERLAHHQRLVGRRAGRASARRRTRRPRPAACATTWSKSAPSAVAASGAVAGRPQPQPQLDGLARRDGQPVPERRLGARAGRG